MVRRYNGRKDTIYNSYQIDGIITNKEYTKKYVKKTFKKYGRSNVNKLKGIPHS